MAKQNYLCIQRSETGDCPPPSPDEMQGMYEKFNAWREKFKANLVDLGGRLGDGRVVRVEGVRDGPFIEAKEVVGGFMILSAESLDEATRVASECPGVVSPRSCLEVREIRTP